VDSELFIRLADDAIGNDGIDPDLFLRLLAPCRGQISAVLAAVGGPGRVVVLKGNKPLEFRYSRRHRTVAYATDAAVLDDAIEASYREPHDWRPMVVEPMAMLVFREDDILRPDAHRLDFIRPGAPARYRIERKRTMTDANLRLVLFVYGSLKRGYCNHDRFISRRSLGEGGCRHALDIRPATTVGHLYDLPAGFPALEVPEAAILAVGTGDPLADGETQARVAPRDLVMPEAEGDWGVVHGELITFADPAHDLPPLDRLEGSVAPGGGCCPSGQPVSLRSAHPDGHGLYRRALVAVRHNPVALATADTPPRPSALASAAAHSRRARSSRMVASRENFSCTVRSGDVSMRIHEHRKAYCSS